MPTDVSELCSFDYFLTTEHARDMEKGQIDSLKTINGWARVQEMYLQVHIFAGLNNAGTKGDWHIFTIANWSGPIIESAPPFFVPKPQSRTIKRHVDIECGIHSPNYFFCASGNAKSFLSQSGIYYGRSRAVYVDGWDDKRPLSCNWRILDKPGALFLLVFDFNSLAVTRYLGKQFMGWVERGELVLMKD